MMIVPDSDPLVDLLESEFAIHEGRPQHRPTYDTGRKQADGTGLDQNSLMGHLAGAGEPTTRLIFEQLDGRWHARFEELE